MFDNFVNYLPFLIYQKARHCTCLLQTEVRKKKLLKLIQLFVCKTKFKEVKSQYYLKEDSFPVDLNCSIAR